MGVGLCAAEGPRVIVRVIPLATEAWYCRSASSQYRTPPELAWTACTMHAASIRSPTVLDASVTRELHQNLPLPDPLLVRLFVSSSTVVVPISFLSLTNFLTPFTVPMELSTEPSSVSVATTASNDGGLTSVIVSTDGAVMVSTITDPFFLASLIFTTPLLTMPLNPGEPLL